MGVNASSQHYALRVRFYGIFMGFSFFSGHFTQVVWKESTKQGVAFSTYQDGEWNKVVVVANYYPAGNMRGTFEGNVKASFKN